MSGVTLAVEPAPTGVVALSGNPRVGSRTSEVARYVADHLTARLGFPAPATALEVADVAGQLFAGTTTDADRYRSTVARAAVVVVATPVYKASYTGLLKAFFDGYPAGGLRGVVAVPVVVSASPAHSFVAEHVLRPLLVELGALVPVKALAVTERELADLEAVVHTWADEADTVLDQILAFDTVAAPR